MLKRCLSSFALWLVLTGAVLGAVPTVKSVLLQRDDGGKPGAEVKYFKPSDRRQHFTIKLDKLKLGQTRIRFVFTGVSTSAGGNLEITSVDTSGLVANEAHAAVTLPRDWPFGDYKADVFIDGQLAKSIPYVISPAPADLEVLGSALYKDNNGRAGERIASFPPTQHKQHFALAVNGYLMDKCNVQWTFTAVETPAGSNVTIATQKRTFQDFKGNTLTGHVELPRDWPTGKYRADVTLNGRALGSIPYEVKQ